MDNVYEVVVLENVPNEEPRERTFQVTAPNRDAARSYALRGLENLEGFGGVVSLRVRLLENNEENTTIVGNQVTTTAENQGVVNATVNSEETVDNDENVG